MKNILILTTIILLGLASTGCSATWDGVKQDTGEAYDATKKAINDATD